MTALHASVKSLLAGRLVGLHICVFAALSSQDFWRRAAQPSGLFCRAKLDLAGCVALVPAEAACHENSDSNMTLL